MKKAILIAAILTAVLAVGAWGGMLTSTAWTLGTTEDFTAYDPVDPGLPAPENVSYIGKVLGQSSGGQANCSYDPWENWQLPQFRGEKLSGNNTERLDACSATYQVRCAWRGLPGCSNTESFNRVSVEILTNATTAADYSLNIIASHNGTEENEELAYGSNAVPMWDVSNLSVRPHVRRGWDFDDTAPSWIGPDVALTTGVWHTLDVCYNLLTGEAEWYVDGGIVATMPLDPDLQVYYMGRSANNIELWQMYTANESGGAIWVDNLTNYSGEPIPEPSSLVALGTLGLGMLGLIRRRRV